jgi:hypothetical protein
MEKVIMYLVRFFYWANLRKLTINIQRAISGENLRRRTRLPKFYSPEGVEKYINEKFKYRRDDLEILGKKMALDWVSDPEVFQTKLLNINDFDGDCDDYHYWVATALSKIPGVKNVMMTSVIWVGGGHAVCTYSYKGDWWLFNYGIKKIDSPNDVPRLVLELHAPEAEMRYYVFEDLNFKLLAVKPKTVSEIIYKE